MTSKELIRLYPITFRYLDGDKQFSKYQWIKAKIQKNESDIRPESYKVKYDSIQLLDIISPVDGWNERKKWILNKSNMFKSLESMMKARDADEISMGIIKPKHIKGCIIRNKTKDELNEALSKKKAIMNQLDMFREKLIWIYCQ
ncbi:MAG: hypothetical protein Q7J27_01080 [Syntrophales bacterium]|nr:hypothetical protein [Syntrophales bacterium]